MSPSSDSQAFRACLYSAKSVIILAGAGLSAGSGLPTFRDENGLWTTVEPDEVASKEVFRVNPGRVWQFSQLRRDQVSAVEPNAAHRVLASLNNLEVLKKLCPSLSEPTTPPLLITQNIDNLSLKALAGLEGLSSKDRKRAEDRILEMHGNAFETQCTVCQHVQKIYDSPLCAALSTSFNPSQRGDTIPIEKLPRCGGEQWNGSNRYGRCGGLLRPRVVWFGEIPYHLGEISRCLNWCDLLIVIGTSSTVYPACEYADVVARRGGKVAVFNLKSSEAADKADFAFFGPCEETIPEIFGI